MQVAKKETENEIALRNTEIKNEIFFLILMRQISNLFLGEYICH